MTLQQLTIDLMYLGLVAMGDVLMALAAVLVIAAVIDGIISGLQMLNKGD